VCGAEAEEGAERNSTISEGRKEPNDVSVETRKGLQMYGCMAIVICMYFVGMYIDYL